MVSFGYVSGRDVGVAMLLLLLAIKPFEIRNHRDHIVTLFLTLFLILSNILFSQSPLMAFYLIGAVLAVVAVMTHLHHPLMAPLCLLKRSGRIMIQALPIMVVFFLLFLPACRPA